MTRRWYRPRWERGVVIAPNASPIKPAAEMPTTPATPAPPPPAGGAGVGRMRTDLDHLADAVDHLAESIGGLRGDLDRWLAPPRSETSPEPTTEPPPATTESEPEPPANLEQVLSSRHAGQFERAPQRNLRQPPVYGFQVDR